MQKFVSSLYDKVLSFLVSPCFHGSLISVGVLLRLKHYFENRSFWTDEAWVAVNIVSRSWQEMFYHLPALHDWPNRPLGFSLIEKFSAFVLGNSEYAFRLFPVVAGILAMFLFYKLLKEHVGPGVTSIALGLFVFSEHAIHFSVELKQYSSDILIALILFRSIEKFLEGKITSRKVVVFGFIGALSLWVSHSAIFILAGFGLVLTGDVFARKREHGFSALAKVFSFWAWSFVLVYKFSLSYARQNVDLVMYWDKYFYSGWIFSASGIAWLKRVVFDLFSNPGGLMFPGIGLVLFVVGAVVFFKKNKTQFFSFSLPFLLILLTAVLKKYPFQGRLLLFALPVVYMFIAQGVVSLTTKLGRAAAVISIILIVALFCGPVMNARYYLTHVLSDEPNREVLSFVDQHYKSGDFLFLNAMAQTAYWYYVSTLGLNEKVPKTLDRIVEGKPQQGVKVIKIHDQLATDEGKMYGGFQQMVHWYDEKGFFRDYQDDGSVQKVYADTTLELEGIGRAWVFFAHDRPGVKDFILNVFDRHGKRLKAMERNKSAAYLYSFGK
ncbi:MAG: glycosyltransferase family 39 protein [Candidatus Omnitrophica bacterium]|nr:glycosyltransferase family 39 protein [Candidatus Omnitrophota bacterium]